ncbi:MAG TPA: relaxase/mobilization nuclease domain-containing protein [Puia sp.]|jgi:hypothetical protein|nr:relaxase/mobilization nuclease domain-containing protein [Puia sp.]
MVTKITSPHSFKRALNYNEKKVQKGDAECIHAKNFLKDVDKMNFHQKLKRFDDLIALNERTKKSNTLHISLNFDPSEKLNKEKLIAIADEYMSKIGFGDQPYLVYEHHDAGHPHIHIVTTNIEEDGKRINTYNIGKNQSEQARKEIEKNFDLVQAAGRNSKQKENPESINVQKVKYGKSETKRAITNVLDVVVNQYKYTSLAEFNAILKQYNVFADRGHGSGRIYKNNGLLYVVLDENGKKIGVPIKASAIYSKPTLPVLEKKFEENKLKRMPDKQRLKTAIEWAIAKKPQHLEAFIKELRKDKIQVVLRTNEKGFDYGITFIDYRTRSIFNGSDIGKEYSIASIQERLSKLSEGKSFKKPIPFIRKENQIKELDFGKAKDELIGNSFKKENLADILIKSVKNEAQLPFALLEKKKKKKRKLFL